ncbi:MAG: hypothetical protein V4654_11615 [Bdellovibrionota bacterium]
MKKNYYFFGSLLGLLIAAITAYSIMGNNFFQMMFSFTKYNGFIPIFAGIWTVIIVAKWCDRTIQSQTLLYKGVVIPVFIFSSGAITGSLLNLMNMTRDGAFTSQAFDYFIKPIYWLGLIGLPAAIIVGIGYYVVNANKTLT